MAGLTMTVTASGRIKTYAIAAGITGYAAKFPLVAASDLLVYVNPTAAFDRNAPGDLLTEGVHYTLAAIAGATTPTIVPTPLFPNAGFVTLYRITGMAQTAEYTPNDGFPAKSHEAQLDRLSLVDQEQQQQADDTQARAIMVPSGESASNLPNAAQRAETALTFDSDGNPTVKALGSFPIGPAGLAANTFTSLADLAAAPTAQFKSATIVGIANVTGGSLVYETANAPYTLGPNVFQSDQPLTTGAWVRVGSLSVTTQPGWTIAPNRTQGDKNDDTASVFDVIPANQHAAILAGTSAYEATADLKQAVIAAAAQKRRLLLPPGLYNVRPTDTFVSEAGVCLVALPLLSGLDIIGYGAMLKVVSGVSTDAAPARMALLGTNQQVSDIEIEGVTFDMNGANNPISPQRGSGVFNTFNQAPIFISGTPNGAAAWGKRVRLLRNTFQNCAGTSCVVMAQTNQANAAMGSDWLLAYSRFYNNGLDTNDHTSVFAWADNVLGIGNGFVNQAQITDDGRGVAALWEVHGSNQRLINNWGINMLQGVTIGENNTSNVFGTRCSANYFAGVKANGFNTFGVDNSAFFSVGTEIVDNTVLFDTNLHPGYPLKKGVSLDNPFGVRDVTVSRNRIQASDNSPVASCAVSLSAATNVAANTPSKRVVIDGNTAVQTTFGAFVRINATTGLGEVQITNNRWQNLTPTGSFAVAAGESIAANGAGTSIAHLTLLNNSCVDDRGSGAQCNYATNISCTIGLLTYAKGSYSGMTTDGYFEDVPAVITKRQGTFLRKLAYSPGNIVNGGSVSVAVTWGGTNVGDLVSVSHELNSTGAAMRGWVGPAGTVNAKFVNDTGANINFNSGRLVLELRSDASS